MDNLLIAFAIIFGIIFVGAVLIFAWAAMLFIMAFMGTWLLASAILIFFGMSINNPLGIVIIIFGLLIGAVALINVFTKGWFVEIY